MTELDIVCDRCGKVIRIYRIDHWTAGAYDVSSPAWRQFAREGERHVCTPCMHADPAYRALYGGAPAILFSGPEEIYREEPEDDRTQSF